MTTTTSLLLCLDLLIVFLLFIPDAKSANLHDDDGCPRINSGTVIDATDPFGNIPVQLFFGNDEAGCSAMIANQEWVVTAGHCFDVNVTVGTPVGIGYMITSGAATVIAQSVVAEIFLHPRHAPFDLFRNLFSYMKADFGMFRLETPIAETCQDGLTCSSTLPNVPMNAIFAYTLPSTSTTTDHRGFLSRFFFPNNSGSGSGSGSSKHPVSILGYGVETPCDDNFFDTPILRKAVTQGTVHDTGYWTLWWLDTILTNNTGRTCAGDSGGPWVVSSSSSSSSSPATGYVAVAGITSGGSTCDAVVGFSWAFAFTEESLGYIRERVESTGGTCSSSSSSSSKSKSTMESSSHLHHDENDEESNWMQLHCLNP